MDSVLISFVLARTKEERISGTDFQIARRLKERLAL